MALKKIGALWRKKKDTKTYFTGTIEIIAGAKMNVVVMPFEPKDPGVTANPKAPAYTILLSQEDNSFPRKLPEQSEQTD